MSDIITRMARCDARALAELVRMGVKMGEPIEVDGDGCESCIWHIENPVTDWEDGGVAHAILAWIKDGYGDDPRDCVLHPIVRSES